MASPRAIAIGGSWRIDDGVGLPRLYRRSPEFRVEHPLEIELLAMSSFLMDYPFADRLYPNALAVLKRLRAAGKTVILTDGDVVSSRARSTMQAWRSRRRRRADLYP